MPKRSRKPIRRFVGKTVDRVFNAADKITKTVGSMFCAVELTASTVAAIPMKPNNAFFGGRVGSLAACFNQFRFTHFKVILFPQGHNVMAAYDSIPNAVATSPAYADFGQLAVNAYHPSARVNNTNMSMSRRCLVDNIGVKWWNSRTTDTDDQLEYQGMLYFVSDDTYSMKCKIEYALEFVHPEPLADYVSSSIFRYPLPLIQHLEEKDDAPLDDWDNVDPLSLTDSDDCAALLANISEQLGAVVTVRRSSQKGSMVAGSTPGGCARVKGAAAAL